jgi:hypothetical protein
VARELARTRAATGYVAFTPADGPGGRRRIVAFVEQDGLPRARLVVARYRAPGPDDDLPGQPAARTRLGALLRSVARAPLAPALERDLVGSLRAARRALRPPAPRRAVACRHVRDFASRVRQAPGRSIRPDRARSWTATTRAVGGLLRCR